MAIQHFETEIKRAKNELEYINNTFKRGTFCFPNDRVRALENRIRYYQRQIIYFTNKEEQ